MIILLMGIDGYYWLLLAILLVVIIGYSIGGYYWLFN